MIKSSREPALKAKEEQSKSDVIKITKTPPISTPWSGLKDPRVVRVSRAFGGKDRHSKVFTVKGLRDRRIRLSVPTAIQLYNLQDRLGLNQPSKVVDWLLDIARHEIDELPPLQLPPVTHTIPQLQKRGLSIDKSDKNALQGSAGISSNSSCARSNHSSLPSSIDNVATQNSILRWDPSCLSLSNFGSNESELRCFNLLPLPSTQSYFPAYVGAGDFDPKPVVNYQMLGSSSQLLSYSDSHITPSYVISQQIRPFHLSITPNVFPPQSEPNKEN